MKSIDGVNKKIGSLIFGLGLIVAFSEASYGLGIVKVNTTAGKGLCLPQMKGSVSSILKRNGIKLYTGNNRKPSKKNKTGVSNRRKLRTIDGRARAVAEVLYTIENIGNGKFKAHRNVSVVFGNTGKSSNNSRRTEFDLQLNPGGTNVKGGGSKKYGGTNNRALIAHELGHYVGRTLYIPYFEEISNINKCNLTRYSYKNKNKNPRNEEFAEVFAAYVTNPEIFKTAGSKCRRAFKFFAKAFGERRAQMSCQARRGSKGNSEFKATTEDNRLSQSSPGENKESLKDYKASRIPVPTKSPRSKNKSNRLESEKDRDIQKEKVETTNIFIPERVPVPTARPTREEDVEYLTDEDFDDEGELLPDSVSGLGDHHHFESQSEEEEIYLENYRVHEESDKEKESYYYE